MMMVMMVIIKNNSKKMERFLGRHGEKVTEV